MMTLLYEEKLKALEQLCRERTLCKECSLRYPKVKYVFGSGNPNAQLMFIGEGPGLEENRTGIPFTGRSGKVLDRMIEYAGIRRKDVYLTNVVKCRPMKDPARPASPHNLRAPSKNEIEACLPVLNKQIEIVRPYVICTLGTLPAQVLLETQKNINELHGMLAEYDGIRLIPTYHPGTVMRSPWLREAVVSDMRKVKEELALVSQILV